MKKETESKNECVLVTLTEKSPMTEKRWGELLNSTTFRKIKRNRKTSAMKCSRCGYNNMFQPAMNYCAYCGAKVNKTGDE